MGEAVGTTVGRAVGEAVGVGVATDARATGDGLASVDPPVGVGLASAMDAPVRTTVTATSEDAKRMGVERTVDTGASRRLEETRSTSAGRCQAAMSVRSAPTSRSGAMAMRMASPIRAPDRGRQ